MLVVIEARLIGERVFEERVLKRVLRILALGKMQHADAPYGVCVPCHRLFDVVLGAHALLDPSTEPYAARPAPWWAP